MLRHAIASAIPPELGRARKGLATSHCCFVRFLRRNSSTFGMESMDDLASPSAEPPGSFSRLGVGLRISLCPGGNELLRAGQVPGVRIFQILEAVGEVVALEARPLRRRRFGKSYCSSPGWSGRFPQMRLGLLRNGTRRNRGPSRWAGSHSGCCRRLPPSLWGPRSLLITSRGTRTSCCRNSERSGRPPASGPREPGRKFSGARKCPTTRSDSVT